MVYESIVQIDYNVASKYCKTPCLIETLTLDELASLVTLNPKGPCIHMVMVHTIQGLSPVILCRAIELSFVCEHWDRARA